MLEIKFKPEYINRKKGKERGFRLSVNGFFDKGAFCSSKGLPIEDVMFYDENIKEILSSESIEDLIKYFTKFNWSRKYDWWEGPIEFGFSNDSQLQHVNLIISLDFEALDWAKLWSINEFTFEFMNVFNTVDQNTTVIFDTNNIDKVTHMIAIYSRVPINELLLRDQLERIFSRIKTVIEITENNLIEKINADSVIMYFNFPDSIKTACNQYLIYFTQFIADLGIDVDSTITEEPNATLFKVTPKDKKDALSKIREALDIYLNAPGSNSFQLQVVDYNDTAVKQWEANVYHLKSQLALANTILQSKDATIEALQLSNYQYKKIIDSKDAITRTDNGEDLIKDIVTVRAYDGKGFTVNFPEILRRLKRKIVNG